MFEHIHLIYYFDLLGVSACAISGTILAYRKGLDIFGALFVSLFTAIGGGTVRDLLLNNHPIFWLIQLEYLMVIIFFSIVTQIVFNQIQKIDKILRIIDAVGLAAFTIIGVEAAIRQDMSPAICVLMGVITASFGGIIRDIICNEIPLVFRKEIYISASLIGAICYLLFLNLAFPLIICYIASMMLTFSIRVLAIYFDLSWPQLSRS